MIQREEFVKIQNITRIAIKLIARINIADIRKLKRGVTVMTNFKDRERVVRQWLKWSKEKRLVPEPKNFLAYLELQGYIDVEKMLKDSKDQEER